MPNIADEAAEQDQPGYPQEGQGSLYRVRKKLVNILLNQAHPIPVREVDEGTTLGGWIQTVRNETNLTKKDLAAALDASKKFIEQLSSDTLVPWTIEPVQMVNVLCLFRLHFRALTKLAFNSATRRSSNNDTSDPPDLVAWLSEVSSELTRRGCTALLDD